MPLPLDSPPTPAQANPQPKSPTLVFDPYQYTPTWSPPRYSAHSKQRRKNCVSQDGGQHEHHQRMSPIQQAPDEYSAGHTVTHRQQSPVDSLGYEPYAKRRVDGGQIPGVLDVGQQQRVAGYPNQQEYQPQTQAHWHNSGTQQPSTPLSQLSQPVYQHSPTYGSPGYAHAHAHPPTQSPSMYANPLHPAPPPWDSTQGQEYNYHSSGPTAYARPVQIQAPQQPSCISPTHTTGLYPAQTIAGSSSSMYGFIPRPTLPMGPGHIDFGQIPLGHIPAGANGPLRTRPVSSPAGPSSVLCGTVPPSAVAPQVQPEPTHPFNGDDTTRRPSGPPAAGDVFNSSLPHELTSWDDVRMKSFQQEWWFTSRGVSDNSHHPEEPMNPLQLPSSMVDPGDHLFSAGLAHPSPVGFAPADGPSSHSPRPPAQADLTSSILPTNPGAARAGPGVNININASSPSGKSNQRVGPDRGDTTHKRRDSGPYQRPIPPVARKTRPVKFEGNLGRLQERCRRQRADENAIMLLGKIFANGVSLAALTRPLTDAEVETGELGIVAGKVYTSFLRPTNEEDGGVPRFICRLCYGDKTWMHAKDVLRHLRRDHVGLPEACEECHRKFYTKGEKTRHLCK